MPDLLAISKGLGAGYQPIGALLVSEGVYAAVTNGSLFPARRHVCRSRGSLRRGARPAARARERGLVERVGQLGPAVERRLRERFGDHPYVGDIPGRGFLLVADRPSKRAFDPKLEVHADQTASTRTGAHVLPDGGAIDGRSRDHVLIAPPFIITDSELEELMGKLAAFR